MSDPTISATATIRVDQARGTINPNVYGHFAEHLGRCVYEGLWVGEDSHIPNTRGVRNDVVAALKRLRIPVLRWPGGCFADEYHWRDGIGPRERRPKRINTHWGSVIENNHFGTHEFFDLCEQLGCEPYVCGNVGSGSPQEMMEWIEYMTSDHDSTIANERRANGRQKPWKLKYFGVGNESWGCGGHMRPEFYADEFRRYNTFVKNYSGNRIERFACGANGADYNWTEMLMSRAGKNMDGLSVHYYAIPSGEWSHKGAAVGFSEDQWHSAIQNALRIEEVISKHAEIMDKHDPQKKVGMIVDEWGMWYDPEPGSHPGFLYQQNTIRDAVTAAINLNVFHAHRDRVTMTNIAQMVNVLQAMILTDGARMLLTPTYHAFEMYKVHQGATFVPVELDQRLVHASASRDSTGTVHLSLANLDPHRAIQLTAKLEGLGPKEAIGRVLTAPAIDSHNTFDQVDAVKPQEFRNAKIGGGGMTVELPPRSVVVLALR